MTGYSVRMRWQELCRCTGRDLDVEQLAEEHFRLTLAVIKEAGIPEAPGLTSTLRALKADGCSIAVVSSSDEWFVRDVTAYLHVTPYLDYFVTKDRGPSAQAGPGDLPDCPKDCRCSRPSGAGCGGQYSRLPGPAPSGDVQCGIFWTAEKHTGTGGYGCHHRADGGAFGTFVKWIRILAQRTGFCRSAFYVRLPIFRSMLHLLFTLDRLSLQSPAVLPRQPGCVPGSAAFGSAVFCALHPVIGIQTPDNLVKLHRNSRFLPSPSTFTKTRCCTLTADRYTVRCSLYKENQIVKNPMFGKEPHGITSYRASFRSPRSAGLSWFHAGPGTSAPARPPVEYFLTGLRGSRRIKPDLIVLTGDLVHEGTVEDYQYLRQLIERERCGIPVIPVLGNHDLKACFYRGYLGEEQSGRYNRKYEWNGYRFLVLDTSTERNGCGSITDEQVAWLAEELQTPAPQGRFCWATTLWKASRPGSTRITPPRWQTF